MTLQTTTDDADAQLHPSGCYDVIDYDTGRTGGGGKGGGGIVDERRLQGGVGGGGGSDVDDGQAESLTLTDGHRPRTLLGANRVERRPHQVSTDARNNTPAATWRTVRLQQTGNYNNNKNNSAFKSH